MPKSKTELRRIEKWRAHLFPLDPKSHTQRMQALMSYGSRELTIVAAAILDAALAELLEARLRAAELEAREFLGLGGDGRAPLGTLGARIQAAYLLGLTDEKQTTDLRRIKDLRNHMAHRATATLLEHPAASDIIEKWRKSRSALKGQPPDNEGVARESLLIEFLMLESALTGIRPRRVPTKRNTARNQVGAHRSPGKRGFRKMGNSPTHKRRGENG